LLSKFHFYQGFVRFVLPGEVPRDFPETSPEISAERSRKVPPESSAEDSPNVKKHQGFSTKVLTGDLPKSSPETPQKSKKRSKMDSQNGPL
jgi:hypothetical protein